MAISRKRSAAHLVWLDLEMTGLNPLEDVILQAAMIITDENLKPLEEFVADVWQPDAALANMTPFVRRMHEKTGLIERVRGAKFSIDAIERLLLERIAGWCSYPAILCGNSIGQDKRFLERYTPGLAGYLSYRVIDVTSLKLLAQRWYGENAAYSKPEAGQHDALVDIKNSIAELQHYRSTLFRGKDA